MMTKEQLEEKLAKALKKQAKLFNEIEEITEKLEEMENKDTQETSKQFLISKGFINEHGDLYSCNEDSLYLEAHLDGSIQMYFAEESVWEAEEGTISESVEVLRTRLYAKKKWVDEAVTAFDKVFGEKQQ